MEQKRCISSLTLAELTAALKAMGQPGFRAGGRDGRHQMAAQTAALAVNDQNIHQKSISSSRSRAMM